MIRPAVPADTSALIALAAATGVFKPLELDTLQEVLDDFHDTNHEYDHFAIVSENADIDGFAYYAPAAMTDRAWYLYWIAVSPASQGRGTGRQLLQHAEAEMAAAGGRILLIETSGLPHYEPARRFYRGAGYDLAAEVGDYYADGDDQLIFRKRLTPA